MPTLDPDEFIDAKITALTRIAAEDEQQGGSGRKKANDTPGGQGDRQRKGRVPPRIWVPVFLKELALSMNVSYSCWKAGITTGCAYDRRKKYPKFAQAWDAALRDALDLIKLKGFERAAAGKSDLLTMFFLERRAPQEFGRPEKGAGAGGLPGGYGGEAPEVKENPFANVTMEERAAAILSILAEAGAIQPPDGEASSNGNGAAP